MDEPRLPSETDGFDQVEELLETWRERFRQGEDTPAENLCRAAPELAPELKRRIDNLRRFEILVQRIGSPELAEPVDSADSPAASEPDRTDSDSLAAVGLQAIIDPPTGPGELGRVNGYSLRRVLGRGGMGVVVEATDEQLKRRLVLKMIRPDLCRDPDIVRRFMREAQAAAAITHDHLMPVYQIGRHRDVPFIVMPFLPGETLETRLRGEQHSSLALLLQVARETALGLRAAHDSGIVHRDIKPSNLWLEILPQEPGDANSEQRLRVKVLDFGLARLAGTPESLTPSGQLLGTPDHMAPEQVEGKPVDGRADLFSLGCILYRMATGTKPFHAETQVALLHAVVHHHPPPVQQLRPAVPESVSTLIMQLLAKNPDDRPSHARDVVDRIVAIERTDPAIIQASDRRVELAPVVCPETKASSWLIGTTRKATLGYVAAATSAVIGIVIIFQSRDLIPLRQTVGLGNATNESTDSGSAQPPTVDSVRVTKISVLHESAGKEDSALGEKSFFGDVHDLLAVTASLSRPAYAYLIAFAPDGSISLCYPDPEKNADTPPALEENPGYPTNSQHNGGSYYGLEEGAGLHVFVLVASSQPLPAFPDWRKRIGEPPWQHHDAIPNIVWEFRDGSLKHYSPQNPKGMNATRGTGERIPGSDPLVQLVRWYKEKNIDDVAAVAFEVRPKPDPVAGSDKAQEVP